MRHLHGGPPRGAVQATLIKVLSLVMEPPRDRGFQLVLQEKPFSHSSFTPDP